MFHEACWIKFFDKNTIKKEIVGLLSGKVKKNEALTCFNKINVASIVVFIFDSYLRLRIFPKLFPKSS